MSGYLEVKYPIKSNLGLNPFKSWKRQWCIVRPSATTGGGSLAVYCSEGGNSAGAIALPIGGMVRRATSRSRPHAFAVFAPRETSKPCVLLASSTAADARLWMDKIRTVLSGENLLGTETLLKDSYTINVVTTDLSRKCGLSSGACALTLSSSGVCLSQQSDTTTCIEWKYICDVALISESSIKNRICVLSIISGFVQGSGEMKMSSVQVSDLVQILKQTLKVQPISKKMLSKSDGELCTKTVHNDGDRSSWYRDLSDPPPVHQYTTKECEGESCDVVDFARMSPARPRAQTTTALDDAMSDRRSLLSVASGIYEEIAEVIPNDTYCPMSGPKPNLRPTCSCPIDIIGREVTLKGSEGTSESGTDIVDAYCPMAADLGDAGYLSMSREAEYLSMSRERSDGALRALAGQEPTYESVAECVYATVRRPGKRVPPPPLPPRLPFGPSKSGSSWNTRHGSLGSLGPPHAPGAPGSLGGLPRCCSVGARDKQANTLPKQDKKQAFSVFRKRLKSDSRIINSPKSEIAKENKDIESKKKRFDFTPTRDIFKNFRVSRKVKKLSKEETKSCEFLDEPEQVSSQRSSKSVEYLEKDDLLDYDANLSIEFNDDVVADLALPQEIVEMILRSREQMHKMCVTESEDSEQFVPPALPAPPGEHYVVMSPKTNLA